MHPTFKQVPPKLPLDSTHTVCQDIIENATMLINIRSAYFQAQLSSLNGSNVTTRPATNNAYIVLI